MKMLHIFQLFSDAAVIGWSSHLVFAVKRHQDAAWTPKGLWNQKQHVTLWEAHASTDLQTAVRVASWVLCYHAACVLLKSHERVCPPAASCSVTSFTAWRVLFQCWSSLCVHSFPPQRVPAAPLNSISWELVFLKVAPAGVWLCVCGCVCVSAWWRRHPMCDQRA